MKVPELLGPDPKRTVGALALLWYRVARAVFGTPLALAGTYDVWGIPWPIHFLMDLVGMVWLAGGGLGMFHAVQGRGVAVVATSVLYAEAAMALTATDKALAVAYGTMFAMGVVVFAIFAKSWFRPNPYGLPGIRTRYSGTWETKGGPSLMVLVFLAWVFASFDANPAGLVWLLLLAPDALPWVVAVFAGPRAAPIVFLAAPPGSPTPPSSLAPPAKAESAPDEPAPPGSRTAPSQAHSSPDGSASAALNRAASNDSGSHRSGTNRAGTNRAGPDRRRLRAKKRREKRARGSSPKPSGEPATRPSGENSKP